MRFTTRIWLAIAVLLAGYLTTVGVGLALGVHASARLNAMQSGPIPAALQLRDLRQEWDRIMVLFQNAVVDGTPAELDKATEKVASVLVSLAHLLQQHDRYRSNPCESRG